MDGEFDRLSREIGGGYLPRAPEIEFLYRIIVDCGQPIDVGDTPAGVSMRVIPIVGGRFEGPRMRGRVLPLGADWNSGPSGEPGRRNVDTRYLLETEDGAVICLSTLGFSRRLPEALALRAAGKPVDPASYYFAQHLFFESAAAEYSWLDSVVAFGMVMSKFKGGPGVIYDAYAVR
ncbi:MAG: DUF3237 domain-containing protein [Spirochaetaceae bacterium]|nr:DUF3237 domain-containing protein [Spirochaetaceae bacterium]